MVSSWASSRGRLSGLAPVTSHSVPELRLSCLRIVRSSGLREGSQDLWLVGDSGGGTKWLIPGIQGQNCTPELIYL